MRGTLEDFSGRGSGWPRDVSRLCSFDPTHSEDNDR